MRVLLSLKRAQSAAPPVAVEAGGGGHVQLLGVVVAELGWTAMGPATRDGIQVPIQLPLDGVVMCLSVACATDRARSHPGSCGSGAAGRAHRSCPLDQVVFRLPPR